MTSEEWADWLDATPADRYRYSGDMFRGLVANLAAAEERAEKWETAASGYIISNNALAAKLEECRGAMRAQDEREEKAGERCGVSRDTAGCDWPDAMADMLLVTRKDRDYWAEKLREAVMLLARALPNRSDLNDEQKRAWYALRDALLRRWPDKEE